ncbi:hypothetical protein TIFTF001_034240 [Ficus carica]|uniref:Uncharacterized protein n=1 Tax=Ficus carica TaxID=3494 RepID=A0AA88DZX3_FICCA|nr:hypothetical protein TIFTF001_034240 [Ficus carica]
MIKLRVITTTECGYHDGDSTTVIQKPSWKLSQKHGTTVGNRRGIIDFHDGSMKTVVEVKYSPFLFRHSAQLEKLCFSHIDTPALSEQISYQIAPTTVPYAAVRPHPPPVLVDHHSCKS